MKSSNDGLPRIHDRVAPPVDGSGPKYLARMSWQKDILDLDSSSSKTLSALVSPTRRTPTLASSASTPSLPSAKVSLSATMKSWSHVHDATSKDSLSYQECMDDVEGMLQEHMKTVNQRRHGKAKALSTLKQAADHRDPFTREFEFAPLREPTLIAQIAQLQAEEGLEPGQGSDDDEATEATSSASGAHDAVNGNSKYFGVGAKAEYYKTYQELHNKPQLFIDSPKKRAKPKALKASAALSSAIDLRKASILKSVVQMTKVSTGTPSDSALSAAEIAKRRLALQPMLVASASTPSTNDVSSPSLHSPRVRFLSACIAKSHPAIAMVLRKPNCREFDFSHQSLGDNFIIQFAACLPDLPEVESINASDNRLSDHALNALLVALENKPNLTTLDISENEIGRESARSLRKYIASSLCTVKTLELNDADIDDHECTLFMIAFEQNKSVERLRMRSNRIGQTRKSMALGAAASAAATLPSDKDVSGAPLPTGGEAIGSMLNVNLTIQELDLSWNMVRYASVSPIATALLLNYNLRELNLAYNGCGDGGAMQLGHALRTNSMLQKLNLAYNSIGPKGGLVIASGLIVNKGLKELVLDGNAIGLESGRELMHAACTRIHSTAVCALSMFECNLTSAKRHSNDRSAGSTSGKDSGIHVYNPSDPSGRYQLDLSDPYEHMIAHELLRLATYKRGYKFAKLEHTSTQKTTTKIELHREDDRKKAMALAPPVPERRASQNSLDLLFSKIDQDNSGSIDQSEIAGALQAYGIQISDELLQRVLHEYDYDHSGALGVDEFEDFFLRCGFAMIDTDHSGALNEHEIEKVLKLMGFEKMTSSEIKRMVATYDLNGSGEIDEQEFIEFMKAEVLQQQVVAGHDSSDSTSTTATATAIEESYERTALRDASGVIWKVPTSGVLAVDFQYDLESADESESVTFGDRQATPHHRTSKHIAHTAVASLLENAQKISKNTVEQAEFFRAVVDMSGLFFTATQAEQVMKKQGVGKSWPRKLHALQRFLPQMVNRHEAMTLVNRVVEPAKQWQQRYDLRRAMPKMYSVMCGCPTNRFRFDLAHSSERDALKQLAMFAQAEKLFSKNRAGRFDTSQNGDWENFRNAKLNGHAWLLTSTFILNSLLGPTNLAALTAPSGVVDSVQAKRYVEFDYVSTTRPPRGTKCITSRRFEQLVEVWVNGDVLFQDTTPVGSLGAESDVAVNTNAQLRWQILRSYVFRHKSAEAITRASTVLVNMKSSLDSVQRKLNLLELLVADRWFSCEQAATILSVLPDAILARARAATLLFSRVVDTENFMTLVDSLSPEDQKECIKRLGWLNVLDPAQPDRQYPPLDLSIRDEREVVQLLATLGHAEGHGCWKRASYRATAADSSSHVQPELPRPGWGDPNATGDESLKHHGIVRLCYDSTGATACVSSDSDREDKSGWALRVELRKHTLCGTRLFLQ